MKRSTCEKRDKNAKHRNRMPRILTRLTFDVKSVDIHPSVAKAFRWKTQFTDVTDKLISGKNYYNGQLINLAVIYYSNIDIADINPMEIFLSRFLSMVRFL